MFFLLTFEFDMEINGETEDRPTLIDESATREPHEHDTRVNNRHCVESNGRVYRRRASLFTRSSPK